MGNNIDFKDKAGVSEMAKLLSENKMEGALMIYETLPEEDQVLFLDELMKYARKRHL